MPLPMMIPVIVSLAMAGAAEPVASICTPARLYKAAVAASVKQPDGKLKRVYVVAGKSPSTPIYVVTLEGVTSGKAVWEVTLDDAGSAALLVEPTSPYHVPRELTESVCPSAYVVDGSGTLKRK